MHVMCLSYTGTSPEIGRPVKEMRIDTKNLHSQNDKFVAHAQAYYLNTSLILFLDYKKKEK